MVRLSFSNHIFFFHAPVHIAWVKPTKACLLGLYYKEIGYVEIHTQISSIKAWLVYYSGEVWMIWGWMYKWDLQFLRIFTTRVMVRYSFTIFNWFNFHLRTGYLMIIFVYLLLTFIFNTTFSTHLILTYSTYSSKQTGPVYC